MTLNEINIEELYENKDFAAALDSAASADDISRAFQKENVTLTDVEAKDIFDGISQNTGELSEESLDNVSGGGVGSVLAAIITAGGTITVGTGVLIAGGIVFAGAAAITAYVTYQRLKRK